ncbi:hypothetical protein C2R72_07420 [Helicobacter pylori]|uniref:Uncharacterized protein n=1 Tax=Helicobacter pylori TaxID=210 RepID=A0A2T6V6V2_HELPX|nr:hypothetical protein C2R72_07420 [Helicobacter pylori]
MSLIDRGDYSIYGVKKVESASSFIKTHAVKSAKSRSVIYESRRYETARLYRQESRKTICHSHLSEGV